MLQFVEAVVNRLAVGGRIFIQTDIEVLAEEMFELFRADKQLNEVITTVNPFPVRTERELAVEEKQLPVYRVIFYPRLAYFQVFSS